MKIRKRKLVGDNGIKRTWYILFLLVGTIFTVYRIYNIQYKLRTKTSLVSKEDVLFSYISTIEQRNEDISILTTTYYYYNNPYISKTLGDLRYRTKLTISILLSSYQLPDPDRKKYIKEGLNYYNDYINGISLESCNTSKEKSRTLNSDLIFSEKKLELFKLSHQILDLELRLIRELSNCSMIKNRGLMPFIKTNNYKSNKDTLALDICLALKFSPLDEYSFSKMPPQAIKLEQIPLEKSTSLCNNFTLDHFVIKYSSLVDSITFLRDMR